jgi:hypothetical protein
VQSVDTVPERAPTDDAAFDAGAREACALAMTWLDSHLPLTLIMDLVMPYGPHSRELLTAEPAPAASRWIRR